MIEVAGHPCEWFEPPDALPGRAVIYLHGVRERFLRESPALLAALAAARLRAIAPRTGRSWWLDRIQPEFDPAVTPERYVVDAVRLHLEQQGVKPGGMALVGTSMGGQGSLRISYRHPALFPIAAAIAPAIDFHHAMRDSYLEDDGELFANLWELYGDVERARQDTAILHVHPLNWPRHQWFASDPADHRWHDGAQRLHSKLVALGIPHTALLEARGGGHSPEFYNRVAPEAVQFIVTALDAEARRIA